MGIRASQAAPARSALPRADVRRHGLARQHQEQHRALRRRLLHEHRLAAVTRIACLVSAGAFFAWASPFLPRGLDPATYAGPAALAAALGCMAMLFWLVSTLLSFRARGRTRIMAPWASMFDDETGIYNRAYFMDTLELELGRGEQGGAGLAVYVMQVGRQTGRGDITRLTAEDADAVISSLSAMFGRDDTLAALRPDEFGALVLDNAEPVTTETVISGLRSALLSARLRGGYRLRVGQAVSEPGRDARWMLDTARGDLRAARVTIVEAV